MYGYISNTSEEFWKQIYTTIQCTKLDCRRFDLSTFWSIDVWTCRRFGLSTFWSIDVWVCRRFGLATIWSVDVSVCRRFGLSTFRFVDVLLVDVSVFRHFDQLPTEESALTHQSLVTKMVIILRTTYPNGFLQFLFINFAIQEFYFLNIIYILLNTDVILSIFFQHSNIFTRASHHWCLASNIVLVSIFISVLYSCFHI